MKNLVRMRTIKNDSVNCHRNYKDFLGGSVVKNPPVNAEDAGSIRKIPWRRQQLPTPVFWPGEFHGVKSPGGRKESDMTEQLSNNNKRCIPLKKS